MADSISIISRSVQDGCDKLLNEWVQELSKSLIPQGAIKEKQYNDWKQSHPVSARELGLQTTEFIKTLHDDQSSGDEKYSSSFENTNTLHLIDDLWVIVSNCANSSKPLNDSADGFSMRLDAHVDSFSYRDHDHVAPQFSPILASSFDQATLGIVLPPKRSGRLARLFGVWAVATLKVYLFPNLLRQVSDKEKKLKKFFLQRLRYSQEYIADNVLLHAMHFAPEVLSSGRTKTLRDMIFSEGDDIVFTLAILISSVPHSFINYLQILKVLPAPQPIIAQSLTDVLRSMISKSSAIRAQRSGDQRQLFIDWLNKVFGRDLLHSLVHEVRLFVETCWTSELHKRLQELSTRGQDKSCDSMEIEYSQVVLLLRLQDSFLAFRKLMAPMAGSTSALNALDSVCSSLQLLTDFHIFSRAAHGRLKNRNRVRENIQLNDSLHAVSLPTIYPFYFENLSLPGSALPIPILISLEAVVSIGNSETVFFSEILRAEDQTLVLKPIIVCPCLSSVSSNLQAADICTLIESVAKRFPTDDSKTVINWGSAMPENVALMKAQKFTYWFMAVQCARVALWTFENRREAIESPASDSVTQLKIGCAYRWFPKEAVRYIESFVCLCTQAIEPVRENTADVLRSRGINLSDITIETAPVLSACVANIIACSANQLHSRDHSLPHAHHSSKRPQAQLKIDKPSQLQDHVAGLCRHCHSLIQTSIDQIQSMIQLSSVSCIAFQRHALLFDGITLDDLQAYDLHDLEGNEREAERLDVMIRVCAADNMFMRLFDVFDHHSPLIPSSLFRLPGAGGIPFLNFPELRLRRLCERVHLSKLIKILAKQFNEPGPLLEKLMVSYERIRTTGLFGSDKAYIIRHLLLPRSDMGGNCIVGKLHDNVASAELIDVANSIWETICSQQYLKLLNQLISAEYPIEFGIRLRLLVEPLCTILQHSSKKEFGADDIIPLTEFVFYFVFVPRAVESSESYIYLVAKLSTFKEMLNDEFAQSYIQVADQLIHNHCQNDCPHQNWQGDIPAVKKLVQQLLSKRDTSPSEFRPFAYPSPFQVSSSDDDVDEVVVGDATDAAGDSLSASELAALALGPRSRGTVVSIEKDDTSSSTEENALYNELIRSCIKRNSLLQTLHQANVVRNHSQLYKVFEDCLRASEAIDMMLHLKFCDSRADAIKVGKLMVADGLISPADHNKPFADRNILFRCVKPVLFESSLTITWGFLKPNRHFALYWSSDFFTLCWFKDKHKSEVRGKICIYSTSVIKAVDEMDFELSHVQETKKGYGLIKDKCLSLRADSKQLRDRWVEELMQAQKRLSVAAPERARVEEVKLPSFFQPSSFQRPESVLSPDVPSLVEALAETLPGIGGSGEVLSSNSSPLLSARQPALIEPDHVFYRGAHLSFNDFLLTALSESEWCVLPSAFYPIKLSITPHSSSFS